MGYNKSNNSGQKKSDYKKHSGAKRAKNWYPKTGDNKGVEQFMTYGWMLSNGQLISVKCVTTSKSKLSEKGWFGSIGCSFTNSKSGESHFHWGTMEKSTGKVVIDKLSLVLNPKAPNGGYCGTFNK